MHNWISELHLVNRVLEASPILPFACFWLRYNTIPHRFNLLQYYIGAEVLFYILNRISRTAFHNDVYVFHLSTLLTVLILIQVYCRLLPSTKVSKVARVATVLFIVVAFLDATILNGLFKDVNSYSQSLGSIILSALALLHIVYVSRTNLYLEDQPDFYFSIAVLLYFPCTVVTNVAINIIYNSGYDTRTAIPFDDIITGPDSLLFAIHMSLLAWMFSFFPLSVDPLQALPHWLHYSRWHLRPYKLLGQNILSQRQATITVS